MSELLPCHRLGACARADANRPADSCYDGLAPLRALVVDHRTAGLAALQRLAVDCDRAMALHADLSAAGVASVVLATCNRTEIYWHGRTGDDGDTVVRMLSATVAAPTELVARAATTLQGDAAARHLFRVCAGLESLVLGEAEILGQVRAALEACTGAGPFLQGVVLAAIRAGRRTRAETAIGVGALSVASAAVQLIGKTLALAEARVVVVGAGDTGRKAARHLRALGVGQLVVANRTLAHAERLARAVAAEAIGLEGLSGELLRADAIVCAVTAPSPVIVAVDLRRAAASRHGRPLVVVDLGMPPAVEPNDTPGVTHVNLAALEAHVAGEHNRRAKEIPHADAVVARELTRLRAWAHRHALRPIVSDLRQKLEAIRRVELARAQQELLPAGALHVDVLDRLSRRLLERMLAIPVAALDAGDPPLDAARAQYLRQLLALAPGGQPWR